MANKTQDLSDRLSNLSPAKRALLEKRLGDKLKNKPQLTPIPRLTDRRHVPLSFAQRRLWLLSNMLENPAYNTFRVLKITGNLNLTAVEKNLEEIIRRHEILRTTFTVKDGQPVQVISRKSTPSLTIIDLRDYTEAERATESELLIREQLEGVFDLKNGPLLHLSMLQMDNEEYIAVLTMHHIISDGWSIDIFLREFVVLYQSFSKGVPSALEPLPLQFADFAAWQQDQLTEDVQEAQLTYWRKKLKNMPATLELPTDKARPAIQTFTGDVYNFDIAPPVSESLKNLAQQAGSTLFITCLTAFKILLYRYSRQTDIVVGIPTTVRDRVALEKLIGFFVNTLALRSNLEGNPTFTDLLNQVHHTTLSAQSHKDIPFEAVVADLQPQRTMSHSPIFQVMFVLENEGLTSGEVEGLNVESLEFASQTAKFDLTLFISSTPTKLTATLEYNTDLFNTETIIRMADHFQMLLTGIVKEPQTHIADLPLLTPAEQQQILDVWNNTHVPYPKEATIQQLFEAVVEAMPNKIALICENQQLTYRELNQRANKLAHYLRAMGVGPEVLVSISLKRSPEMVIGILGILKAGGAYLALDTDYPPERLEFMLMDTQTPLILTESHLAPNLQRYGAQLICIDTDWSTIVNQPDHNPTNLNTATNLVYVMYTSGSTGNPKGVAVIHRNVIRLVKETNYINLTPDEVFLQFAPISFDASTLELWAPLLNGGKLVIFPAYQPSLDDLGYVIEKYHISSLWLTAGLFHQMVETNFNELKNVRQLLAGGDILSVPHVKQVLDKMPNCQLINGYGPTENTTFSTCYPVKRTKNIGRSLSIGQPITNTTAYILDQYLHLVPVGVMGELYVGGDGVTRQYLNVPRLTAERFIPNPYSIEPGDRLYKTGDMVRYLPDGNIEFLGRNDNQIKLRGFRIELGEIETALKQHPAIQKGVVVLRDDAPGGKGLVAYLVSETADQPPIKALRKFIETKLPSYMIPVSFMFMDALPLTANGKVNRKALPEPIHTRPELLETFVGPRNATEETLTRIWGEVLDLESIGIYDNFFELGGHSLLATQIISRIQDEFQIVLHIRRLFETATIAHLAEHLTESLATQQIMSAPPIEPISREQPLPTSFAQKRLWVLEQLGFGGAAYNIPFILHISGPLDVSALTQALTEIIRRHENLRTTFGTHQGEPIQIIASPQPLTIPTLNLTKEKNPLAKAKQLAEVEAKAPFNLNTGPLLRVNLAQLGEENYVLMINMHHIISDGWSVGLFFNELRQLYQAYQAGQSSPLPELTVQYADFAQWQRNWLQGTVLENHLNYWQQQLQAIPPVLELPFANPRPAIFSPTGRSYPVTIPPRTLQRLKNLSRRQGVTLFMSLLAAWKILLYRYTNQTDILIGTPIANRNYTQIEPLLGFFANTLVIRSNLSENLTFRTFLKEIQKVCTEAYAHQDMPFEQLVDIIHPERSMSHTPLFQISFSLERDGGEPDLSNLKVNTIAVENNTSKFDLGLHLSHTDDSLSGLLAYNTVLFNESMMSRVAEHFKTLLQNIVDYSNKPITQLTILPNEERNQLLTLWNQTQAPFPAEKCWHHLFEEQVQKTPEANAVIYRDQPLTYQQLDQKANQLAHYLQSLGVHPEVKVGVCMERTPHWLISFLAILKTGGVYIPMDPAYPVERLRYLLNDSQVEILLTQEKLADKLPLEKNTTSINLIALDTLLPTLTQPTHAPQTTVSPMNLAYIIYTSGSTGQPKGTLIPHQGLVNMSQAQYDILGLNQADRMLQLASLSFDASIFEIVMGLRAGATIYLDTPENLLPGPNLIKLLQEKEITTILLTPSALAVLPHDLLPKLRLIIVAGENCYTQLVNRWAPERKFFNLYGPTEATIWTTAGLCEPNKNTCPIGYTISNVQTYLLDEYLEPVPLGVPGELYIGGISVGRGYLNRPTLTAEKFTPNPFSTTPGERLYKTGDLGYYHPDGNIEYVSRIDHQVKIRGFRIEVGEVENAIHKYPSIREAIVRVHQRDRNDQNKQLVAYVVPRRQQTVTSHELKSFLQENLPEYMVPTIIILLKSLPLTPNGKVDLKALPTPTMAHTTPITTYVAPQTEIEQTISQIWCDLLKRDKVGLNDNFFDLGGQSLLLVQMHTTLEATLKQTIPIATLFKNPTVGSLAQSLSEVDALPTSREQGQERAETRKALRAKRQQSKNRRRNK